MKNKVLKYLLLIGIICNGDFVLIGENPPVVLPLNVKSIKDTIKNVKQIIDKPEYKGVKVPSYRKLRLLGYPLALAIKHPDLEIETKIYRSWYEKVANILTAMSKMFRPMGAPYAKDNKKMQATLVAKFNKIVPVFKKILDNPQYVSSEYLKKITEMRDKKTEKARLARERSRR